MSVFLCVLWISPHHDIFFTKEVEKLISDMVSLY